MSDWYLYMIRCANGSLYTGITTDVERRLAEHSSNSKKGAKYLKGKGPLTLAWHTPVDNRGSASKLEYRIKRLCKADKERIINNQLSIKDLDS